MKPKGERRAAPSGRSATPTAPRPARRALPNRVIQARRIPRGARPDKRSSTNSAGASSKRWPSHAKPASAGTGAAPSPMATNATERPRCLQRSAAWTGSVISMCQPRHRHSEWLKFLRLINRRTRKYLSLHLIVESYATHSHPEVQKWLARNPRFVMHFTPTSASCAEHGLALLPGHHRQANPARQHHQRGKAGTCHRPVRRPSQH